MSEESKKNSFFQSLKNSILKTDETESIPEEMEIEESVLKSIQVKTVTPKVEPQECEAFKGVSTAKDLDIKFAENFSHSGGKFIFCESHLELTSLLNSLKEENEWNHVFSLDNQLNNLMLENQFQKDTVGFLLDNSDAAISYCYNLSAEEGVIILSPQEATNRRLVNFPENHIIIAYKHQLKKNVEEAVWGFKEKYEGRLASVLELYEGKPVAKSNHKILLSADGPKNVFLFYIDSEIE